MGSLDEQIYVRLRFTLLDKKSRVVTSELHLLLPRTTLQPFQSGLGRIVERSTQRSPTRGVI